MALSKQQEQTKELSEKSGLILVNFANEESTVKAIYDLHSAFREAFNVTLFNAKKASKRKEKLVRNDQQRLNKLFDELQVDKALKESETIGEYNLDYYCLCHGQFVPDARYQDGISMLQELEANGGTPFDAVLAILVFQYLKDENRKQIKKCELPNCDKYHMPLNRKKRHCCPAHKQAHYRHNKTVQNYRLSQKLSDQPPPVISQGFEPTGMADPVCPS